MKATEDKQVSVFLANHPGVVAELCTALADAGVSIRALSVLDTVDVGTLRLMVDDVDRTTEALKRCSAASVIVPVLILPVPNRRGSFAEIARTMAAAGVNIEYFYATALPDTSLTLGVFRVNDVDTALQLDYPDE